MRALLGGCAALLVRVGLTDECDVLFAGLWVDAVEVSVIWSLRDTR